HSHSLPLSIITEIGIIGFVLFLFICCISLKTKNINASKTNTIESAATISIILAVLTNQLFEDFFAPLNFLFILVFTILYITFYNLNRERTSLICKQC